MSTSGTISRLIVQAALLGLDLRRGSEIKEPKP